MQGPRHRDDDSLTVSERLCFGCRQTFLHIVAAARLCPSCRERMYETLAHRITPAYNPAVWNEWEQCCLALWPLYGTLGVG